MFWSILPQEYTVLNDGMYVPLSLKLKQNLKINGQNYFGLQELQIYISASILFFTKP